ncbi:MAG: UDP-N-acetylenolpyruvoylglucosamine reductase, partial [Bacteroidota bacterium]
YEVSPTLFKVPAGWLIEQAGFKGNRYGDAGVHAHQALVLVNHGSAKGSEIWELALRIQKKIKERFDIYIEPEVNVI